MTRKAPPKGPWLSLALALGLSACARTPRPGDGSSPEMRMWGVRMVSFRGPEQVAVGTAVSVAYERESADVSGNEAEVTFLGRRPEPDTTLLSTRVTGNLSAKGIDGEGGVAARNTQGLLARSPRAHLDLGTDVVTGPGPVDAHGPGYDLLARQFRIDLRSGDYHFSGPVETELGGSP